MKWLNIIQPVFKKRPRYCNLKVFAVASGGGHWIELLRLIPAFADSSLHFVTVNATYRNDVAEYRFDTIRDATRWNPFAMLVVAWQLFNLIRRERPEVVVTTGAAPGLIAIMLGKFFRARTIWVDSIANVDELSGSGQAARGFADLWLTQWEELASDDGPEYAGKVL